MKSDVKIGTCGFRTNKTEYAELLSAVEVQQTFYQPTQISTLQRWREAVPPEFEFTVKAWQLITHEGKSPTYKRLKKILTDAEREEAGRFQPTAIVKEAWETTLACAKVLQAKTILFQCPASFKPFEENIANLEQFFSGIERGNFNFVWEPRGGWDENIIKRICEKHDLWHVVDPFAAKTVTPEKCYYRLHGRGGWRYEYEADELEDLTAILPKNKPAYVFFNNIRMTEDAIKFQEMFKN
jgi:uncharacterized protein YecE (DUF72 family)